VRDMFFRNEPIPWNYIDNSRIRRQTKFVLYKLLVYRLTMQDIRRSLRKEWGSIFISEVTTVTLQKSTNAFSLLSLSFYLIVSCVKITLC